MIVPSRLSANLTADSYRQYRPSPTDDCRSAAGLIRFAPHTPPTRGSAKWRTSILIESGEKSLFASEKITTSPPARFTARFSAAVLPRRGGSCSETTPCGANELTIASVRSFDPSDTTMTSKASFG